MYKPNGVLLLVFFLVSSSVFSPKWIVSGSPLQERSSDRPDPLSHFKDYNGGYDIGNKHYWASAAFTGVYGYAIAGVWLLCGLGYGIFLIVKNLSKKPACPILNPLDSNYYIMISLILLFTILVLVATSFGLAANQKMLWKTKKMVRSIVKMGGDARDAVKRVTSAMIQMQYLLLPYDPNVSFILNSTRQQLGRTSLTVKGSIDKKGHELDKAIETSYIIHLVVVIVNLAMLVAAIVMLLLHWHPGYIPIIFCCWILTSLCWVLTGIDFFLFNFVEDTCSALVEFEQNPYNNSLSTLLPCIEPASSENTLNQLGYTIHTFITQMNSNITDYYKYLGLDEKSADLIIGGGMVCNPFLGAPDYSYSPQNCAKDAIPIGNLPNVIGKFTCYQQNSPTECKRDGKFITPITYQMASAYSVSIQDLLDVYPDLQSFSECTFMKDRISDVVSHQCRPFRASIRLLWSSMLSLSMFMVVLVLLLARKSFSR